MLRPLILSLLSFALAAAGGAHAQTARTAEGLVLPFLEVTVSSPVQSYVEEHLVDEGDHVEEGELLTRLASRIEQLDMKRAASALEKREFDYQGIQNLYRDELTSADEALASRIERDLAQLQYEIAAERVAQREVRAPIGGVVVERRVDLGEAVGTGDPIFVIVDFRQVYVQLLVEAEQLRFLRQGQNVRVRFPELALDGARTGVIDFIDPRVDPASGLLRVKVLVDNPGHAIKVGVRAVAEFLDTDEASL